jgi:hypothetical protein
VTRGDTSCTYGDGDAPLRKLYVDPAAGIPVGSVRDGGSFRQRACHYSSWNSYFQENEYQVQRWNEFLSA